MDTGLSGVEIPMFLFKVVVPYFIIEINTPCLPFGILHLTKPSFWALSLHESHRRSGTPWQRVTHTAPSGSRGLGQFPKLFPRETSLLLSRFGCSWCQAEEREGQVLGGVWSCWGFVLFIFIPSAFRIPLYRAEPKQSLVSQAKGLAFLSTQIFTFCCHSQVLSHGTEYPIGRTVAQK